MGNYENLKQSITEVIRTNGNQEITGAVLQSTLLTIISTVGANATFAGIATPTTNPGTPDGPVFYLASEAGTYTNFNAVELQAGLSVLMWNGSWNSQQIFSIDNEPTAGSDNLVKSGGVAEELALGAVYDVSAKNPTSGVNNDGKWESLSALLSDTNLNTLIPTPVRKGGMSIKFIQSSDNKYVQYRLMSDTFNTTPSDWQGVDEEPTAGSDNLVKSGGVWSITSRLYDGTLAPITQHTGILFTKDIVKEGAVVNYKFSNLKADGTTYSSACAIGLFDVNDTRIGIIGQITGATGLVEKDGKFTIPANFAYAATIWSELTLEYLYTESGLIQTDELLKKVAKYNNVDIIARNSFTFNGANVTISEGYMRLYIDGLYMTFHIASETTFNVAGNACLVVDKTSYTLSVKTEANVGDNDWILLIHDAGTNDFEGGLLYKYYQNKKSIFKSGEKVQNVEIDTDLTPNSNKLTKSGVLYPYISRVLSGNLCLSEQFYTGSTVLFTNKVVKEGDVVSYSLSNLKADGTTYLSDAGIGLFDANNTRIAIVGQIGGASTLQERSGEYIIPSNFAYAAALWSGLTIHYVKAIGIDALTEEVNGTNDVLGTIAAPQFVYSEADTTFKRFLDWKGNDDAVLFGFVTDIHSYHIDEKPKVMNFLKETSKYFGYDVMVCGGDLAIETTENAAQAIQMLTNFARYSKGVFNVKGNHDWYSTEQSPNIVGNGQLSTVFIEPNKREYNVDFNNAGNYGSFVVRDILVLLVNSCGCENSYNGYPFGYTDEQVNYIISKLENVQQGQNVIMFSHVVANEIGGWNSYPVSPSTMQNGVLLNTILADFISKSSGSSGNFSWDFTNIDSGCKFIASIGGHTHFNHSAKVDGINFIVRQGYAGVPDEEIISGGVTYPFSITSQCCFDCIAVKPSKGQMKIFRIGAGGSAADSAFTF